MGGMWKPTRSDLIVAAGAAVLTLVTSPLFAVWSLAVGAAVALGSLLVAIRVRPARIAFFAGVGLMAGALPYLLLALVMGALGGAPPSGSG